MVYVVRLMKVRGRLSKEPKSAIKTRDELCTIFDLWFLVIAAMSAGDRGCPEVMEQEAGFLIEKAIKSTMNAKKEGQKPI